MPYDELKTIFEIRVKPGEEQLEDNVDIKSFRVLNVTDTSLRLLILFKEPLLLSSAKSPDVLEIVVHES